jgi:hypothetical protein
MRTETLTILGLTEYQWVDDKHTILALCDWVKAEFLAQRLIRRAQRRVFQAEHAELDTIRRFSKLTLWDCFEKRSRKKPPRR